MASSFTHEEDPLNRTELILKEESGDYLEQQKTDSITF